MGKVVRNIGFSLTAALMLSSCAGSRPPSVMPSDEGASNPAVVTKNSDTEKAPLYAVLWDGISNISSKTMLFDNHENQSIEGHTRSFVDTQILAMHLAHPELSEHNLEVMRNAFLKSPEFQQLGYWEYRRDQVFGNAAVASGHIGIIAGNVEGVIVGGGMAIFKDAKKLVTQQSDGTKGSHTLNFVGNAVKNTFMLVPNVIGEIGALGKNTFSYFTESEDKKPEEAQEAETHEEPTSEPLRKEAMSSTPTSTQPQASTCPNYRGLKTAGITTQASDIKADVHIMAKKSPSRVRSPSM